MECIVMLAILAIVMILFFIDCYQEDKRVKERQFEISRTLEKDIRLSEEIGAHLSARMSEERDVLKKTNQKQQELINEINRITTCYPVGKEKIALNKIKELTQDYQSKS